MMGVAKRAAAQLAAPVPVKRDPYIAWGAPPKAKPFGADGRGWDNGATASGRFWVMVAVAVTTVWPAYGDHSLIEVVFVRELVCCVKEA